MTTFDFSERWMPPELMPPELMDGGAHHTESSDMWAFGCVCYGVWAPFLRWLMLMQWIRFYPNGCRFIGLETIPGL